ncbi:MAG TPA: MFS transporter [Terriglobales bacterium]|nr:MFS transporter [Terriglobales bacterium]
MATPALSAIKPGRIAGIPQGLTLVAMPWVSVLASGALIGPVLPRMTEYFRAHAHVDVMIALVATMPALFVALLSVPFGMLADRTGPRRLLFWACMFYGGVGMLPYWLQSLSSIVISRALVGVAEAAVMTCGVALIGDYFNGVARDRWYALQTAGSPFAALAASVLGGALGLASWHGPFLVYSFGFVLFILVATLLWEPRRGEAESRDLRTKSAMNWPRLLRISATTVFAMSAFLVTVIQFGFLLTERGISSPQTIGMWQGLASLASPLGALAFGALGARHIEKAAMSFTLMAAGFAVIACTLSWQGALAGTLLANFGSGMILPTLVTWAVSDLPSAVRGRGVGVWVSAAFLGQFVSPLAIVGLKDLTGSLSHAILCYAVATTTAAAGATFGSRRAARALLT